MEQTYKMLLKDLISKNKILSDLLKIIPDKTLNHNVNGISGNSKNIKNDYIFVAIKGTQFNGSDFINEARQNGAFLIIDNKSDNKDVISTNEVSTRLIYTELLASFYEKQPKEIIGVTGTNGKTSTVEFCRQLWVQSGWKAASMGTLGTKIENTLNKSSFKSPRQNLTTFDPDELYKQLYSLENQDISHLALEASSHGLDQFRLDGVKFTGAIFTNLSHDHLDYHKNIENYFNCKKRLFTEILQNNSAVAINIDDNFGKRLFNEIKNNRHIIITFGKSLEADVKINSIKQNNQNIDLILEYRKQIYNTTIGMIGEFQSYNVVAAASICIALGIDANLIFNSISYLKPARGRMEMIAASHNNSIVVIDYAHTPEALRYVLNSIKEIAKEKIITLFGCGGDRDKEKRKSMGELAKEFSDLVIVTDDNPRSESPSNIRKDILEGCPNAEEIPDRNKAINYAISKLQKNDFLIIAGKGHETSQTIGMETLPFDDHTVAKETIKNIEKLREAD
jgi:UDP-N-acetylmuramoyl-L-alanyl-D-glutamate--2,6-diaminopimelate ligase